METNLRTQLNDFYQQQKIHPVGFDCKHKKYCSQYSTLEMTEAKMTMVGSQYGRKYPRIAIISLDPPNDGKETFKSPENRTVEYVTRYHESEDYRINRPNIHWAMTQIIVKDLLVMFGYSAQSNSAVVHESIIDRYIENVSAYFVHVNVAKCCMNNKGKVQAARQVHQMCGNSFVHKELDILLPEILISQGKDANQIVGDLFGLTGIEDLLPITKIVQIGSRQVLWLPMDHPARYTGKIHQRWPFYVQAVKKWKEKSLHSSMTTSFTEVSSISTIIVDQHPETTETLPQKIITKPVIDQPGSTDFGLYKCGVCGKLVMGYDWENHLGEAHGGKSVEWKKVR